MEKGKGYREQFYHEQNIQLRKEMRQFDFKLAQGESIISLCSFLVVGPPHIGKSSLLKSLQFALNGSQGWGTVKKGAVTSVEIKKGSKWQIEGVKELREMSQKYAILGMQLSSEQKPSLRYKKALQFVEGSYGSCMVQTAEFAASSRARVCLIMLSSSGEIPSEEITYLKFLRMDMLERGVKTLLLLKGTFNRQGDGWKRIQARITYLQTEFQIKRDDIICMDTYCFDSEETASTGKIILKQSQVTNKVENNQEINFYALQLLLKIVRESERNIKARTVRTKGWLCSWA